MKKAVVTFAGLMLTIALQAQITITRDDMPNIGDTLRVSTSPILFGQDPSLTGPGYTWDYSTLQPSNQIVERYVNPNTTPFLYQIVFNLNVANLASPIEAIDFIPDIDITDAYIFYKDNPTNYVRAGYAATVMGIPIPMKFDIPELLYTFPLTVGSLKDSSLSNYALDIPNLAYFSIERKRVNQVDGWGSLTTPLGTFDVLRVRSDFYERDSLYVDSLQTGFPIVRNYTEYQWLGNNQGIPLLSVTVEGPMTTVRYRDIAQNFNPIVVFTEDTTICKGDTATISVDVSGGFPPYSYLWSTGEQTKTIKVSPGDTTTFTVFVTDVQNGAATGNVTVNVIPFERYELGSDTLVCAETSISFDAGSAYSQVRWFVDDVLISQTQTFSLDTTGIGLNNVIVRVEYEQGECFASDEISVGFYICGSIAEQEMLRLKIYPNPAKDYLIVETGGLFETSEILIQDMNGRPIKADVTSNVNGQLIINTSKISAGSYILKISDNKRTGVARFVLN
jgi:hypothetical protein